VNDFRKQLDKCGIGGIKCQCCGYRHTKGRKFRGWSRHTRRALKQRVQKQIKDDLSD
jgi:hypothetical protein